MEENYIKLKKPTNVGNNKFKMVMELPKPFLSTNIILPNRLILDIGYITYLERLENIIASLSNIIFPFEVEKAVQLGIDILYSIGKVRFEFTIIYLDNKDKFNIHLDFSTVFSEAKINKINKIKIQELDDAQELLESMKENISKKIDFSAKRMKKIVSTSVYSEWEKDIKKHEKKIGLDIWNTITLDINGGAKSLMATATKEEMDSFYSHINRKIILESSE